MLIGLSLTLALEECGKTPLAKQGIPHKYDHIVIVIEENKNYNEIIGSKDAPYINNVLKKEGADLTHMYAEEQASEGNYFWLFSGSNQGVGFHDVIPNSQINTEYPFHASNLAEQLIKKGYSFIGYSESLPSIGDTISRKGEYDRKHVPWISFANIPQGKTSGNSTNLQFAQFPSDYSKLPTVAIVIPNLIHDMHDPESSLTTSITNGDKWLKKNIDGYYQWAKTHNSLLIIIFDENDDIGKMRGLTNPASNNSDIKNKIPTIIAGAHVKPGSYAEGKGVTHVNLLRTIEAIYGLKKSGMQSANALNYAISDGFIITDVFN